MTVSAGGKRRDCSNCVLRLINCWPPLVMRPRLLKPVGRLIPVEVNELTISSLTTLLLPMPVVASLLLRSSSGRLKRMPEFERTGSRVTSLGAVSVVIPSANWEDLSISSYLLGSITSTSASPTTGMAAPMPSAELE